MQTTPSANAPRLLRTPTPESSVSAILKLAGETCNVNCHYCYEKRKPYPDAQVLTPALLGTFLKLLRGRPLTAELHGGEPMIIGRDRMRELFVTLRQYEGQLHLKMQTNGTLITDEWLDFLAAEAPTLELGVSVDGDAEATAHRVDYRDKSIHPQIERALHLLGARGWKVGVIAVVTRHSLGRAPEILSYFAQFEAIKYVKFSPCLDFNVTVKRLPRGNRESLLRLNPGGGIPGWGTTPDEYADFLIDVFESWKAKEWYSRFLVEPLASVMRTLAGRPNEFCHFSDQKCAFVLTVYPDGRLGSCDELSMPGAYLGRVEQFSSIDEVLELQTNAPLRDGLDRVLEKCESCSYKATCRGGCLATRLRYQGTPYDDAYCAYRMKIIDHVAAALRQPEPPGSAGDLLN